MKLISENKEFKDTKERDEEFVHLYCRNGGNATQAAIALGVSKASASTVGSRLKKRLHNEIYEGIRDALGDYVPHAIRVLEQLMTNAQSERIQLNAAIDVLDRTGFKAVERKEITTHNDLEKLSAEEVEAKLDDYVRRMGYIKRTDLS